MANDAPARTSGRRWALVLVLACLTAVGYPSAGSRSPQADTTRLANDVTGLNPITVAGRVQVRSEDDVRQALADAGQHGWPVSIAGATHSQGGHTAVREGIVLDMTRFDRVLTVSSASRRIRVQAGATWEAVQAAANAQGMAVAVMQSSNIFTVGGSVAVNVHGRDPRFGPLLETVRSLRVMLASGETLELSPERHPEWFEAMFGSFGLLAVILEVELQLLPDSRLQKTVHPLDYRDYVAYLRNRVIGQQAMELHFGRLSFVPGDDFLRSGYAVDLITVGEGGERVPLPAESGQTLNAAFFDLSRATDWGKRLRWSLQQMAVDVAGETSTLSRNAAMQPPVRFLTRVSDDDADILQEYFVPLDQFVPFIDGLREIVEREDINLLNVTLRYMPGFTSTALPYADSDSVAVVLYINVLNQPQALADAQAWTRGLIDLAQGLGGNYYLPYLGFASLDQFRRGYPGVTALLASKAMLDPDNRLQSRFFQQFIQPVSPVLDPGQGAAGPTPRD